MQLTQTCIVKGANFFDDVIDGDKVCSGAIFIEEPFAAKEVTERGGSKGFRTVEYKCLDANVVKPVMSNEFPITAEVTMELNATKRGQQITVINIKPMGKAMPQPQARQAA